MQKQKSFKSYKKFDKANMIESGKMYRSEQKNKNKSIFQTKKKYRSKEGMWDILSNSAKSLPSMLPKLIKTSIKLIGKTALLCKLI